MDNQDLVLIPGELFTKIELKNRLKIMDMYINPTIQDKSYLVSAYNQAIKHESNKYKLIDCLIDDTVKLKQSNKRTELYTTWKPHFDNLIYNKTINQSHKEQMNATATNKQFTLPPRQRPIKETPNNNTIYQINNTISNQTRETNQCQMIPKYTKNENNIQKQNVVNLEKQNLYLTIGHNELQINVKEKNEINFKEQNIIKYSISQNNLLKMTKSNDDNYLRKPNYIVNQLNQSIKQMHSVPLQIQTLPTLSNINKEKKETNEANFTSVNTTNVTNNQSIPLKNNLTTSLNSHNTQSSIVNKKHVSGFTPFNNNNLSLIDAENNHLKTSQLKASNPFQLEDVLSSLLALTSIILILFYIFRFTRDLTQPFMNLNNFSMQSAIRFISDYKWLILLGMIVSFYFKKTNVKIARAIFKEIKNELYQEFLNKPNGFGFSQKDIISKYALKYDLSSQEFHRLILPVLNDLRTKDSNIKITEEEINGRKLLYWTWFE